jgi:glycosyltransferase involved in cell wall biosynthesis
MNRRILILSPFPPGRNALHGGSRAIANTVAELAGTNRIRLLCLRADGEPPTEPALARLCESVEEIRRPGGSIGPERAILMARSLATGQPLWAGNWRVEEFRRRLRHIARQWRPDIAQFHFHIMAQYLDALDENADTCANLLVVHECGAAAARDRRRLAPVWQRIFLGREASAWDKYERWMLPRFDAVVCFSARDRDELTAIFPVALLALIPPILPPATASPYNDLATDALPPVVLFTGNFVHPPNLDAALRLARVIFPKIRARCPEAVLRIAGEGPPRQLRALASREIEITGRVPDMKPLLAAAAVIAVPLRSGSGVRIKMIEALCAGKAVVATARAAEGLSIRDGQEYVQAETDSDFAEAISTLLRRTARRAALGTQAGAWGNSFCKPGRLQAGYESLFAGLEALPR